MISKFQKKHFVNGKFLTGFTLIEVLVAIFVLITGVIGVFAVIQNITFYSQISSSRLTATYLTQEGVELVRNKRDANWLKDRYGSSTNWYDGIPPAGCNGIIMNKFTRTCNTNVSEDKMNVSVEVSWSEFGKPYSVKAETYLYNWQ